MLPLANATIGEIVRFHLSSIIAEGTTPNLIIHDDLPTGFQFLNDNTATVAFITTTAGNMNSTTVGSNIGLGTAPQMAGNSPDVTPTYVIPQANIGNSATFASKTFGDGTHVYFGMGSVVNTDNDTNDNEYIVIEFNALVTNDGTNLYTPATKLDNTFTVDVNNGFGVYTSAKATVTVIEPKLVITKNESPATVDAGDLITYSLDVVNNGNAIAYGIVITDVLDSNLLFNAATFGGIGVGVTLNGSSPASGANGTVTINATSLAPTGHITVSLTVNAISGLVAKNGDQQHSECEIHKRAARLWNG